MPPPPPLPASPVAPAFPHIQWDPLGSLRLTAQETALLRMAETNPIEYTLADSRDASMYARVLLKVVAEASQAQAAASSNGVEVAASLSLAEADGNADAATSEEAALAVLDADPIGVVTHYAISKLYSILEHLMNSDGAVTVASVFYVGKEGILVDQWKALLRVLNRGGSVDAFAQTGASLCLALILVTACPSQRGSGARVGPDGQTVRVRPTSYASAVEPLEALTSWVVGQLKSSSGSTSVALCVPAMTALMAATESRLLFASAGGIKYLSRQLRSGGRKQSAKNSADTSGGSRTGGSVASVQQLYELTFCLWTMTYELDGSYAVRTDFARDGLAVGALTDLITIAPREKVVRVSLSALRNLATCTSDTDSGPAGSPRVDGQVFLTDMIACRLMKQIDNLRQHSRFTDPDVIDDVEVLHRLLHENYKEMSRWEVYKNEVESGHLQWGTCHTEAFFKENARMMEGTDGDFRLLKVLIALLSSQDEEVASIACHDIGEFVRYYPNGRAIAKRLGAKELVMPLIEHDNVDLQRHALQCVSKIMVQHWEFVKTG
jgi:V-type H+-transporting ATPase subunit H